MSLTQAEQDNLPRWKPNNFFESYYLKWNDPQQQVAAWLRYTLFAPLNREPEATLWGIFFDAKNPQNNRALKETVPLRETRLEKEIFYYSIGASAIFQNGARGTLKTASDRMSWELKIEEPILSLRHFPDLLYSLPFPPTKFLAPHLSCRISGEFSVNDRTFQLVSAPAHQGHLWGTKQATSWVWGNCNSFKEDPTAVFEGLSAEVAVGGRSFQPTLFYLHYQGVSYSFTAPWLWLKNRSRHETGHWHFEAASGELRLIGDFTTRPEQMIGLRYEDTDGSHRYCHNTKVADLKIEIFKKSKGDWRRTDTLTAEKSAAFEVVTQKPDSQVRFLL